MSDDELLDYVQVAYSGILQVSEVRSVRGIYFVITENQQYDDALMDKLLDVELSLLVELRHIRIEYVPSVFGVDETIERILSES